MSQSVEPYASSTHNIPQWVGTEWVVDALGCSEESLRDLSLVVSLCNRVIKDLGLCVVGEPIAHQFPTPGGVTAMFLLSESHLACHTYPEHELATFNLYCCRSREPWTWQEQLSVHLGAIEVAVRKIPRGRPLVVVDDSLRGDT